MLENCLELGLGCCGVFLDFLKLPGAASGLSAIQGTSSFSYLYVDVYICIMLACFQLGVSVEGGDKR